MALSFVRCSGEASSLLPATAPACERSPDISEVSQRPGRTRDEREMLVLQTGAATAG